MLWTGPVQRAGPMHAALEPLPEPGCIRVLGPVPPFRTGQPPHCPADLDRVEHLHAPDEPQHRLGYGCSGLNEGPVLETIF